MTIALNSPLPILTGAEAPQDLIAYLTTYSGRFFEPLAAQSDPNRFEASDVVAVSCLSVRVPAETSGWLLLGDGSEESAQLLAAMNVDPAEDLATHDLAANNAAAELWRLLVSRRDVGPTVASKLLAAKRPHLVPIFDSYVADYMLPAEHRQRWEWWAPWRNLITGPGRTELAAALQHLRDRVVAARPELPIAHLSDLRLMDIVIWMSEDRRRRRV